MQLLLAARCALGAVPADIDTMVPDKEEVSYYELLNVPRDASQDEIKKAYYRYSTVLHPDKQKDDALRQEASSYFVQIKEAHEV